MQHNTVKPSVCYTYELVRRVNPQSSHHKHTYSSSFLFYFLF